MTMSIRDCLMRNYLRTELNGEFKENALAFMTQKNLIPDKAKILMGLVGMSHVLTENIGVKV